MMKLSKLYSNKPDIFQSIDFNAGLSVILGEIRIPANRELDTHNLGKSTIAELIDFCLLKGKSGKFFLFKHAARFAEFTFYLELDLLDGTYLTIGRPVVPGSRIDIKRSERVLPDASQLPIEGWDHVALPFDKAKLILNGILGIEALRPWDYRKLVGYLIRSQSDYLDVFQLGKFSGKHQDWKPFVAHLLGMTSESVIDLYAKREELNNATSRLQTLIHEWGGDEVDLSVLDGLISVKRRDIEAKRRALDSFNFNEEDRRINSEVVEVIESSILSLNEEKYRLTQVIQGILESLEEDKILFRTADAEALFRDAGVMLGDEIKKDYDQLIAFNRAITNERREALQVQLDESQGRVRLIDDELQSLNERRGEALEFLRESESLAKFKELSSELTTSNADLQTLDSKRSAAARLVDLRREQRVLAEDYGHIQTTVEREIEKISGNEEGRFGRLRRYFTEIVHEVLGQDAIIAIKMNNEGGLEFTAEFIGESGLATSGDKGTTYKKLLCIAFDLAMLRSYLDMPFARFVYHDGALEQLEIRKRKNLISVLNKYSDLGIQVIVSVLDSDLPEPIGASEDTFSEEDVVLTLHDEGDDGRLFKMPSW